MTTVHVQALGSRYFPSWLWRVTAGDLQVEYQGGLKSVRWYATTRLELPDEPLILTFSFAAAKQLWTRTPRIPLESVAGKVIVYRSSSIPMFFRPKVTIRDLDPLDVSTGNAS